MDLVLSLSGCGPRLEVALSQAGGAPSSLIALAGTRPRNELIVAAVEMVLATAGARAVDLAGVVATRGPGSFTGLRVTLATAQALCLANALPGHAFPSLVVQAERTEETECLAVQPARRGVVYAQRFRRCNGQVQAQGAIELVGLATLAVADVPVAAPDGFLLPAQAPRAPACMSAAEALLRMYALLPEPDPASLVPLYVEPPAATPPHRSISTWQPSPTDS